MDIQDEIAKFDLEIEAAVGLWGRGRRLCESYRADEQTGSA